MAKSATLNAMLSVLTPLELFTAIGTLCFYWVLCNFVSLSLSVIQNVNGVRGMTGNAMWNMSAVARWRVLTRSL